jgi:hypothetical protein
MAGILYMLALLAGRSLSGAAVFGIADEKCVQVGPVYGYTFMKGHSRVSRQLLRGNSDTLQDAFGHQF